MNNNGQKSRVGKFVRALLPAPIEYYESQQIILKGKGQWRDALCPFHQDKKPSLRVNIEHGSYRCMSCGARGGDVLAFHQQRHNLNFVDGCKELGAWAEGGSK